MARHILNVLLFHGEQIIQPEDLVDQTPRAMYKADDKIREVERDVAKRWVNQGSCPVFCSDAGRR